MPFNDPAKTEMLNALDEALATGIDFIGVHTLVDPGTGTNAAAGEATGGTPAYARIGVWQQVIPEVFGAQGQITTAVSALTLDLSGV